MARIFLLSLSFLEALLVSMCRNVPLVNFTQSGGYVSLEERYAHIDEVGSACALFELKRDSVDGQGQVEK